jgi:hypothetical protein
MGVTSLDRQPSPVSGGYPVFHDLSHRPQQPAMWKNYDPNAVPSPAQVQALREIYRRLVANERWPNFDEVDRALDRVGIDLQEIAHDFPPGLTNLGPRQLTGRDELILHPEALPYCAPDSDDDRQLILRILWLAIEADRAYDPGPGEPDTAPLTTDELSQALGYPETRLFHLYFLLMQDHWFGGGGYRPGEHWFELRIRREIRQYRGVQSYADYMRVRHQVRQPRTGPSPTVPSSTPQSSNPSTPTTGNPQAAARRVDTYDVALSFAGEDRPYVVQVADALKQAGVDVFYDDYERVDLWGKDLVSHLDTIYRKRSQFVVMFVSTHYATKVWTNVERRSALARAIQEKREFILPARFDDTELAGIPDTIAYEDCRRVTPSELSELIVQKIRRTSPSDLAANNTGAGATGRSEAKADPPEPLITARIEQTPGNRPTSVLVRNFGDGAAIQCVYAATVTDAYGLSAWYMTPPIDLDVHESREFVFTAPHGMAQASFTTSDESSAMVAGQRQRRYFDVYVRSFDNDPRAADREWSSYSFLGEPAPTVDLFVTHDGIANYVVGRTEVLVYLCANGHIHRVFPHAPDAPERFDIHDSTLAWIAWYRELARRDVHPPKETSVPKPDARFLRAEPL